MNFEFNDGGREAAGFEGTAGDCVTRALAIFTGRDYAEVHELVSLWKEVHGAEADADHGCANSIIADVVGDLGCEYVQLNWCANVSSDMACTRFGDFVGLFRKGRKAHAIACIGGVARDTYDWINTDADSDHLYAVVVRKAA